MRKRLFSYFRKFVAFLVVCSLLIASVPLYSYATEDATGDEIEKDYVTDGYTVTFTLDTVWNSGYNVSVVIQNTGSETISDWFMYLKYDVDISNMWNASVYETLAPYMVLTNAGWNKDVYSNGTAGFGYTGSGEFPGFPESVKVTSGYDPTAMEGGNDDHGGDTPDDGADTDGDGLTDTVEKAIGSDPELIDTDGDGLSDYMEYYLTWTSPTMIDTDEDGISDADEDVDGDGLGNLDEVNRNTDVVHHDTDKDDLSDYDEIYKYATDPLIYDTDGDGLCDGDDVLLGFDPEMPDTDLNGILDSAEKVYQTTENNFEYEDSKGIKSVSVSVNVSGNIDKEIGILNGYDFDIQSREVVGLIGVPIDIRSDVAFDEATITFEYDESMLGDTSEENLSLMWYDEENHWYQILDQECVLDTDSNTVSYTTTHFSEYCLADKSLWFNTWNDDIDYHEDEEAELTYQPTRYIVIEDLSSFQSAEDTELIEEIKNTLSECAYRCNLSKEGRILLQNGLGKFWDMYANLNDATREYFTSDGYTITPGDETDHLWSPTYRSPNLNSIFDSIVYAYDKYQDYYSDRNLVIFFISNRSSGANEEVLQSFAHRGIRVYTIDIQNNGADSALMNLSDKTNGTHYYGEITHNPVLLVDSLVNDVNGFTTSGSDKDGDGLLDVYEIYGMRTLTGKIIMTDPFDEDSDDDNLSDFEETGRVYTLNLYIGQGVVKSIRYIAPNSDPNDIDTDDDGMTDDVDPYPSKDNMHEVVVHNAYSDIEFLRIRSDIDSSFYNGGNQRWWYKYRSYDSDDTEENNMGIRTFTSGCGLIAASNIELFLGQTKGFQPYPYDSLIRFPLWDSDGCISLIDYMNYVDYNREYAYFLYNESGNPSGVTPTNICSGFSKYLEYNGVMEEATWADSTDGKEVLASIRKMIDDNLPTICAICLGDERKPINLYGDLKRAVIKDTSETTNDYFDCNLHYINIIGYIKVDNNFINYDYYLIVETDEKIYYVDYDSFSNQWGSVTNVLHYEI